MIGSGISHYRILEKLGEGGMGVVYKAEDTKLGRLVALKFLPPHLIGREDVRKRFEREARSAAALSHPNICTVFDIDEVDGNPFIAMELVDGENLAEKIETGPLQIDHAIDIALQAARGLAAAHESGVVHRDVKSGNIMVAADRTGHERKVKIMDFGLARLSGASDVTREGSTLGTITYMSPEQAEGGTVDRRTDIWSLGVVLYEMIAGQKPFRGEFDQAIVYSILNETPEPLSHVVPSVPRKLERIVSRCLSKDPEERYQTADQMRSDLEACRESPRGRSLSATPLPETVKTLVAATVALLIGTLAWIAFQRTTPSATPTPEEPSLAVMPFVNASGDAEFEYFSDGMTVELINALSRLEGLKVASRSSTFRLKGEAYDIKQAASTLGVDHLLEGTIRRDGDRLRITVQLIGAADGFELWAERFDRQMAAVFDIQDEVAREIVDRLHVQLSGGSSPPSVSRPTENALAYDSCLRGEFEYFKLTGDGAQRSIGYFEQAIELDTNFARAHAGLARAYTNLAIFGVEPSANVRARARELVARALELDDSEPRSHAAAAYVSRFLEWDWDAAVAAYRRALELNPDDAETRGSYALLLTTQNRLTEAVAEAERALQLDPLSPSVTRRLSFIYTQAHRPEDGLRFAERALELAPRSAAAIMDKGNALAALGRVDEAMQAYRLGSELDPGDPVYRAYLGRAYGDAGRTQEALEIAQEIERLRERQYVSSWMIAVPYIGIGDFDQAMKWLQIAFDQRDPQLDQANGYRIFDPIRTDPRFRELMRRIRAAD